MSGLEAQTDYWNGVAAAGKTFTHPLPLSELAARLAPGAAVLDYGCGYGRLTAELAAAGFAVTGADVSESLLARGRREHPELRLLPIREGRAPVPDASCAAVLLVAVLNCIPTDAGLARVAAEVRRVLRPGGLAFVSDYPLQMDARNRERYAANEREFGRYGVFRAGEAVFRHFAAGELAGLFAPCDELWRRTVGVRTLNGHAADVLQLLLRPM